MRPPRTTRAAATLAVGVLLALSTALPAHAEDEVNIDHVESVDGQVSLVLAVDGIPGDSGVETSSVRVEVDGRAVAPEPREVWALNKPVGVVSTASEPGRRRAVTELVDVHETLSREVVDVERVAPDAGAAPRSDG